MTGIKKIWIEAENWAKGEWNPKNDNTDVIVTFENGTKYVATFFTYSNIESLTIKNKQTGECMNGKYFWASDMILVDECSRANIELIINDLIKEDEFELVFRRI